jgi:hypothetical protein
MTEAALRGSSIHGVQAMADGDERAVGYKRPPREHQFRRGESGNPAGRPKRRPSFASVLLAELAASMPGNQHGRTGTKLEALVKNLVVVSVLTRFGEAGEHQAAPPTSDDRSILEAYIDSELKRRSTDAGAPPNDDTDIKPT